MTDHEVFKIEVARHALILSPQRNISSLAEDEVQSQWDGIVARLDEPGIAHVVFDFGKINYFGSSMLEAMLYLWKKIDAEGGKMAVCSLSSTAAEIIHLSRFDAIWKVCGNRDEALDFVNE